MGLPIDSVERYEPKSTTPGRFGAAMAHRDIMTRQLEMGWDRVLVLEDDVVLNRNRALHFMREILDDQPWDVMYLGCQANPLTARIIEESTYTFRLCGVTGGFAVAYTPKACENVVPRVPENGEIADGVHFDRLLSNLCMEGGPLVARGPKNPVIAHTLIGKSDTSVMPRTQGLTKHHHNAWYMRMKRRWRIKQGV